jgi:hypothetical protein
MRVRGSVLALLLGVLFLMGCGGGGVPVRNPDPIAAAPSSDATQQAILEALPKRRWTAEDVKEGRIVAFLPVRNFLVRVEIVYDANQVRINYLSSDNLGAHPGADGQVYAHGNVNKWLRNLAVDVARSLSEQANTAAAAPTTSGGATPTATGTVPAQVYAPPAQPVAPVPTAP